jgi:hypothetical protein
MKKIILSSFFLFSTYFLNAATFSANSVAGDWNTPGDWTFTGTDVDGIPDADDFVTIGTGKMITVSTDNQFAWTLTVSSGGTLTFNNVDKFTCKHWILLDGNINGTFSGANRLFIIGSTNSYYITGTGTMAITGDLRFNINFSLNGVTINNTGTIWMGAATVTNNANVILAGGGTINGLSTGSSWINAANSSLSIEAPPMTSMGGIQATATNNTVTLSGNTSFASPKLVNVYNLTVNGTGAKSTTSTNTPTISGNLTINSGASFTQSFFQLIIKGNLINDGTYSTSAGQNTVFSGSSAQSISGSGIANIGSFILSNASGLQVTSGSINISNTVTITAGTFANAGGTITLKSDATRYARISAISSGCVTCGFSGNFVIERYMPSRTTITWADLSSPVSNATMQDWDDELYFSYPHDPYGSPVVYSNVLEYDETVADFAGVNASTTLSAGKGFEITLTDDSTLATFVTKTLTTTGTPNFGTQIIPLSYTNNSGAPYPSGYDGENLIGNPFASAITLSAITKTNTLAYVDVYSNATDTYQSLSGSAIIGPHQGFWAYALGAGASFTIPESAKSANTSTAIRSMEEQESSPFLQLTISSADGSHMMAHTLKVACAADANDGWDLKDHPFRKSLNKNAPSITASNTNGFDLSISTFNSDHQEYSMPLNVQVGVTGKYQINASDIEAMNSDYSCVSLEDKALNKFVDLNENSNYVFFAATVDEKDRFALHFNKNGNCKSVANSFMGNGIENQVQVLPNDNGNIINFNFGETLNTKISVSNLLGQDITESMSLQANTQSIQIMIPVSFSGMYIVRIENEKGVVSKKFVKK